MCSFDDMGATGMTPEQQSALRSLATKVIVEACLANPENLTKLIEDKIRWHWPHQLISEIEKHMTNEDIKRALGFDPNE